MSVYQLRVPGGGPVQIVLPDGRTCQMEMADTLHFPNGDTLVHRGGAILPRSTGQPSAVEVPADRPVYVG